MTTPHWFVSFTAAMTMNLIPPHHEPSVTVAQGLQEAIRLAWVAHASGNPPFGAVLLGPDGRVLLEEHNRQGIDRACTGHAESLLVTQATRLYGRALLADCTLCASVEPCAMCAGAIYWSGIGRVAYAASEQSACRVLEGETRTFGLDLPCREVFSRGCRPIEVTGPVLALQTHALAPLEAFTFPKCHPDGSS